MRGKLYYQFMKLRNTVTPLLMLILVVIAGIVALVTLLAA